MKGLKNLIWRSLKNEWPQINEATIYKEAAGGASIKISITSYTGGIFIISYPFKDILGVPMAYSPIEDTLYFLSI